MPAVDVTIETYEIVHTLPGIWQAATLRSLLDLLDWEDAEGYSDDELLDLVLMALQDAGHQQAGEKVLEQVFGKSLSPGVRQNLVDDLQDDEPWQDFSVVSQQRGIFETVVLMHQAFPNRYPNPDAAKVKVRLSQPSSAMTSASLLRLLSQGMAATDVLLRLYGQELNSDRFAEADGIVWFREDVEPQAISLITAVQWLGSLRRGQAFRGKL